MTLRSQSDWRRRLAALEAKHARNEADPAVANRLWNTLDDGAAEDNLKSVARAIRTFRGGAIAGAAGIDRLAQALKEVFELTGQLPKRSDFDDQLFSLILRTRQRGETTEWLIATLRQPAR